MNTLYTYIIIVIIVLVLLFLTTYIYKKESFDIIGNSNSEVKNYILGKIQ